MVNNSLSKNNHFNNLILFPLFPSLKRCTKNKSHPKVTFKWSSVGIVLPLQILITESVRSRCRARGWCG